MGKARSVILPASDLGTDALSEFNMGSKMTPIPNIAKEQLSSPTPYRESSSTKIDDLSNEQLNKFYLSNSTDEASMKNEMFAEDQSTAGAWTKGIGKFIGKTGTAVIGGTVGLLYGLGSAVSNLEFNKFFDNDVAKGLDSADKWMDDNMKIYASKEAEENAWYEQAVGKAGFAKFWADDVLGGLSFTAGAVLSESIWAAATAATFGAAEPLLAANTARLTAKAANLLKNITKTEKIYEAGTFARQMITGSGYEAGVEARHAKQEILTNMKKEYFDAKGQEVDEKSSEYAEMLNKANSAANAVFGANIAILSAGNAVALPKTFGAFNKGLGSAVEKIGLKFNPIGETAKIGEKGLERAALATGKTIQELKASQFINKWDTYSKLNKGIRTTASMLKSPISEGLWEEGMQGSASEAAKIYVSRKYDPSGIDQTVSLWESIGSGLSKTYGSEEGWKEIGIGMIIGALGLPHVGNKTNEDGTKSRDFSWEGGIYGAKQDIKRDKAEHNDLVDLMNSNKALVSTRGIIQASIRTGSSTDKQEATDLYDAKNQESEDFFNFVHSRHKGGYFANIKDELAEGVKNMKPDEFADAFGYTNMTESELKERQKEVVNKTVERADKIKKAIEVAERMNKNGDSDITEGLAYSISMLDNIDERQNSMVKKINDELGMSVTKKDFSRLNALSTEIKNKTKELKNAEKALVKARHSQDLNEIDAAKTLQSNIKSELNTFLKKTKDVDEREKIDSLLSVYSGNFEELRGFLNSSEEIQQKLKEINPEKVDNIREAITDLKNLDNRRKEFIESYNNLRTKEAQDEFTADMENFKSYLFAEIPEGLTKRNATLAYYKALGQSLKSKLEQDNTPPTQQSITGQALAQNQNNRPPVQNDRQPPVTGIDDADRDLLEADFDGSFEPLGSANTTQPVATAIPPVQKVQPIQTAIAPLPDTELDDEFEGFANPTEYDEPVQNKPESVDDLFAQIGTATSQLGDNAIVQGSTKSLTLAQLDTYGEQMKVILNKLVPLLKAQNPTLSKKDLTKLILNSVVNKTDLTEQKIVALTNVLNNRVGQGIREEQYPVEQFFKEYGSKDIEEESSFDITSTQISIPNNQVVPADYGHDKNKQAATSLAYKSHEYTESNGRMVSTGELAENSQGNNQSLLTSNEAFTTPESITATTQIDVGQVFDPLTLDFDVKVKMESNGQKVTTSIHNPAWLLEIRDNKGNVLTSEGFVKTSVELARNNNVTALINYFNQLQEKGYKFRNVAGTNEEIANQLIELVKIKDSLMKSDKTKSNPVTIKEITPGKVSLLEEYKDSDQTLTDENIEFAVIGQNGELMATSSKNHSKQSKNIASKEFLNANKGATVVLVPTRNGRILPISLRLKKIMSNSTEQKVYYGSLIEFLSKSNKSVTINGETLRFNNGKDVKKIISIYSTFIPNISKLDMMKNVNNILLDVTTNEAGNAIQVVIPNVITKDGNFAPTLFIKNTSQLKMTVFELAKSQGLTVKETTLDKKSNEMQITKDTKVENVVWNYASGKSMFTESYVGNESLLEGKVRIPNLNIDDKSRIIEVGDKSYSEHVKQRTMSNVRGDVKDPLNENKRVYFEQPVYRFEISPIAEESKQVTKKEPIAEIEVEESVSEDFNPFMNSDNDENGSVVNKRTDDKESKITTEAQFVLNVMEENKKRLADLSNKKQVLVNRNSILRDIRLQISNPIGLIDGKGTFGKALANIEKEMLYQKSQLENKDVLEIDKVRIRKRIFDYEGLLTFIKSEYNLSQYVDVEIENVSDKIKSIDEEIWKPTTTVTLFNKPKEKIIKVEQEVSDEDMSLFDFAIATSRSRAFIDSKEKQIEKQDGNC
jgi:hypothetical protein